MGETGKVLQGDDISNSLERWEGFGQVEGHRWSFPGGSVGKESVCNAGDPDSIPGLGRSPGEGNGNPLQYSCLENPMDRGAWQAIVHGVTKSQHNLVTKQPPPPPMSR